MSKFRILIVVFALILSLRIFGGPIEALPQIVSLSFTFILLVYIFCKGDVRLNPNYFLFFGYLCVSTFLSSPNPIFRSWERLFYFVVMLSILSPTFENQAARNIRSSTFKYLSNIFIFAAIGSFFAFFLGINWMSSRYDLEVGHAGHFGGLTNQSMTLAPIAGISCCIFCNKYFDTHRKRYLICSLLCFSVLLISASRGALLATLGGLCVMLFNIFRHKITFYKLVFSSGIFCIALYPIFLIFGSGIIQKSQDTNRDGLFDSRTTKFLARISEIDSSPVIGIGFAAIDPNGNDSFDTQTGTIEPGSSILAIVSMTGTIGLILFLCINFHAFNAVRKSGNHNKSLIMGLLSLFLIHMIVEGYVFAISNPLSIYYWLLIGIAYDSKYERFSFDKKCKLIECA